MVKQTPYPIDGKVQLTYNTGAGSSITENAKGAKIWVQDISEGTFKYREDDVSLSTADENGNYLIDNANITSSYSNGDTIRVYCQYGEIETYTDHTLNTAVGYGTVNFSLTRRSGLIDGIKSTTDEHGRYGLKKQGTGMKKGLKDAMI